ncbi:hypothetical protein [Phormidesmis priestleyi]|nr:hypothetical protein [Phormidesmis priestleyi]
MANINIELVQNYRAFILNLLKQVDIDRAEMAIALEEIASEIRERKQQSV